MSSNFSKAKFESQLHVGRLGNIGLECEESTRSCRASSKESEKYEWNGTAPVACHFSLANRPSLLVSGTSQELPV